MKNSAPRRPKVKRPSFNHNNGPYDMSARAQEKLHAFIRKLQRRCLVRLNANWVLQGREAHYSRRKIARLTNRAYWYAERTVP